MGSNCDGANVQRLLPFFVYSFGDEPDKPGHAKEYQREIKQLIYRYVHKPHPLSAKKGERRSLSPSFVKGCGTNRFLAKTPFPLSLYHRISLCGSFGEKLSQGKRTLVRRAGVLFFRQKNRKPPFPGHGLTAAFWKRGFLYREKHNLIWRFCRRVER